MGNPLVSVVMPVYNSKAYLNEALDSIRAQTYVNWECLVINEFGSNDGSSDIVQNFAKEDSRFRLIQNETRLGLADSLNYGIHMARGKYIARLDADDLAYPTRFEKQVAFMEQHPDTAVCGTWQRHFGPDIEWVHRPSCQAEQCKANLLFFCDLCHSTLMLRREFFQQHHLKYNREYQAEDFELWTRVVRDGKIENLPEVLGDYRWDGNNISAAKQSSLHEESGKIVAKSLLDNLGIQLTDQERVLLCNWHNPVEDLQNRNAAYQILKNVLERIYEANETIKFYDPQCLLNAIYAKWRWVRYYDPFNDIQEASSLKDVFHRRIQSRVLNRFWVFWKTNKGVKKKIKKIQTKLRRRKR